MVFLFAVIVIAVFTLFGGKMHVLNSILLFISAWDDEYGPSGDNNNNSSDGGGGVNTNNDDNYTEKW